MRVLRCLSFALALAALAPAVVPSPSTTLAAQGVGRIVGRVLDAETGAPIAGAVVEQVGTAVSTTTGGDGRYTLPQVATGLAAVRVRMIGYRAKTVTDIAVPAGGAAGQDITLQAQAFEVEELTVVAAAEAGTVARALEEQRTSTSIVSAVTAEEIRKTPDSDAGQAVQRVSGVTVQDGRYIFVRGLGERYTATTLNGSRIPSPEPERKVVPLDLFPSSLLEGITTSKTFTPDQSGDFSGARVDLRTREFPVRRVGTLSTSFGFNTEALGTAVVKAPRAGGEWLGFAGRDRDLPASAARAGDLSGLSQGEVNRVIADFRDVWRASESNGFGNGGLGLSVGGEDPVFGRLIGYAGSLTYSLGQEVRKDEERAIATTGGPINQYQGESGRTSVLWGGMLNLSTRVGAGTRLALENTYTRSADNEGTRLAGVNEQFSQFGLLQLTRLSYTERSVFSTQLRGDHLVGTRHLVDWAGSFARTRRYEPDRSDLVYQAVEDPATGAVTPVRWADLPQGAARTFSDLVEQTWQARANYRMLLGDVSRQASIKVGADYRTTGRDADSRQFDIRNFSLSDSALMDVPERVFGNANAQAGHLTLLANANVGRYTADEQVTAGYLMMEWPLTSRLRMVGGARVERWDLTVRSIRPNGAATASSPTATDVLPSLSLTWQAGETHQLRLSGSQTLSRPEYREVSSVNSFDILGGLTVFGNPGLLRALIRNLDARWEWYPRSGEAVSVAVFAKFFDNPIERIQVGQTGANALSFVNAESAENYGVELEVRKSLDFVSPALAGFTVFGNTTVMDSRIRPGNDSLSSLTNAERPMVGQSELVVNTGLGYSSPSGDYSATVLFNFTGRRIADAGVEPLPDTYEEGRSLLDASLQFPLLGMRVRVDGKNLLDDPVELRQGEVTRLRYRTGRVFSMGLSIGL